MLVDDDCIRSLPAEPNFLWGAEKVYRPLSLGIGAYTPFQDAEKVYRPPSLGMGAYTPFQPLSVLNTLMQVCSSLNIHQSGAFEVGYNYDSNTSNTCNSVMDNLIAEVCM